ncbi:hypothetical protein WN943_000982 [Citrus x changshan-huyou]
MGLLKVNVLIKLNSWNLDTRNSYPVILATESWNTNSRAPGLASKKHKHERSNEASSQLKKGFSHESRASPPPPAINQEETVKEVISETQKEAKISDSPRKVEAFANNAQDKQNLSSSNEEEIMSQVSEICSVSVSESLSTMTNVTDMRDIEEGEQEVRQ